MSEPAPKAESKPEGGAAASAPADAAPVAAGALVVPAAGDAGPTPGAATAVPAAASAGVPGSGTAQAGVIESSSGAAEVEESADTVEPEGPSTDERLWAAAVWMSIGVCLILPPLPAFAGPMIVKALHRKASEFVSCHYANSLRFAIVATILQGVYVLAVGLMALALESLWPVAVMPALVVYFSLVAGSVAWLGLIGHNAWKGLRNRPLEMRRLVFYR